MVDAVLLLLISKFIDVGLIQSEDVSSSVLQVQILLRMCVCRDPFLVMKEEWVRMLQ